MASLFLTDYASYNNGTQFEFGHWVDLTGYSDAGELMEYIIEHFKECDKKSPLDEFGSKREETMFTDYEGFPSALYGESMGEYGLQKIFDYIDFFGDIEDKDDSFWWSLHQEYCSENSMDDEIYENDDEFFGMFFSKPQDAVRASFYGDYRFMDDYVKFNGYGNLDSTNNIMDWIDEDALISWKLENI